MELKKQTILPKHSHISRLILKHIHGHLGRNYMLSKHYCLPRANNLARSIIHHCTFCRRVQGKADEQKMTDLPQDRITPNLPPFTNPGIDYFGPIEVKSGSHEISFCIIKSLF